MLSFRRAEGSLRLALRRTSPLYRPCVRSHLSSFPAVAAIPHTQRPASTESASSRRQTDEDSDQALIDFFQRDLENQTFVQQTRSSINIDDLRSELFDEDFVARPPPASKTHTEPEKPVRATTEPKQEDFEHRGQNRDIIILQEKLFRRRRRHSHHHRDPAPVTHYTVENDRAYDTVVTKISSMLRDSLKTRINDIVGSIDSFRPHANLVSPARHMQLQKSILKAFNKQQIIEYITLTTEPGNRPYIAHKNGSARKANLVLAVISKIWGIKISSDITKDLLTHREVPIPQRRDMVLLLSKNALLLRKTTELGVTVQVSRKLDSLELLGTEYDVDRAARRLQFILKNVIDETFSLDFLEYCPDVSATDIPTTVISQLSETFVEIIDNRNIKISALSDHRLALARRLIILSLKLYRRESNYLFFSPGSLSDSDTAFYNIYETSAIPWYSRNSRWQRWRSVISSYSVANSGIPLSLSELLNDYPKLVLEELDKLRSESFRMVEPAKDENYGLQLVGFDSTRQPGRTVDRAVGELMKRIVRGDGEKYPDSNALPSKTQSTQQSTESSHADSSSESEPAADVRNSGPTNEFATVFDKLEELAAGESTTATSSPQYTAKFGSALHEQEKIGNDADILESSELHSKDKYIFVEHAPIFSRYIETFLRDRNSDWKAHPYSAQSLKHISQPHFLRKYFRLKFMPSPYAHPDSFTDYTPLEMDVAAKDDWKSTSQVSLVSRESDSAIDLCLPRQIMDIRFQRRVDTPIVVQQPGVRQFLQQMKIELGDDTKRVKIPHSMPVRLDVFDGAADSAAEQVTEEVSTKEDSTAEHSSEEVSTEEKPSASEPQFKPRTLSQWMSEDDTAPSTEAAPAEDKTGSTFELQSMTDMSSAVEVTNNTAPAEVDEKAITYLFRSFEQRWELQYMYGEHVLKFCVVESSVLDGRRVETSLSIDPKRLSEDKQEREEQLRDLAKAAAELAIGASLLMKV
ncbi:mitochondrial inner-membrane-bound regulator-domain-containing protein [Myxozyma melibiosi]|uniref:Mitochondrial inner-membrane-bound regulator-domain-containing protein n=1 Tax=Myxozyma melibiosi TaxID=54550 RepID=A0ABR1F297_9ASCO